MSNQKVRLYNTVIRGSSEESVPSSEMVLEVSFLHRHVTISYKVSILLFCPLYYGCTCSYIDC